MKRRKNQNEAIAQEAIVNIPVYSVSTLKWEILHKGYEIAREGGSSPQRTYDIHARPGPNDSIFHSTFL